MTLQTASWLAVRGLAPELAAGEAAQHWLESYRTLLDQWNMFSARAELDIALTAATGARAVSPQVGRTVDYRPLFNLLTVP